MLICAEINVHVWCVYLLQDLIAFIQKNYAEVYFHGVLDLVNILANAAYRPQNFDDFSTFIVQVMECCASFFFSSFVLVEDEVRRA